MDSTGFDPQCSQGKLHFLRNSFPSPIHIRWQLPPDLSVLGRPGTRGRLRTNGVMTTGTHLEGKCLPKVWIQGLPMHLGLMSSPLVWQQIDTNIGVRRTS